MNVFDDDLPETHSLDTLIEDWSTILIEETEAFLVNYATFAALYPEPA